MKKVICIIIAFAITLTCCMAAYAATTTPKISSDVERKISETPDGEKFEVLLWLNVDVPTVEELRWLVRQELGEEWWRDHFGPNMTIDDVHTYDAVYNRLAKEYETAANQAFVTKSGIPEEKILVENRSANTFENLRNSMELIRQDTKADDPKLAFSTTNYHVFRSGVIASRQGIKAEGIGAKTKRYFWINAFIREFIAALVSEWKTHLAFILTWLVLIVSMIGIVYSDTLL